MSPVLSEIAEVESSVAARRAAGGGAAGWQRALEAARRLAWFHGASAATEVWGTALPRRPAPGADSAPLHPLPRVDHAAAASGADQSPVPGLPGATALGGWQAPAFAAAISTGAVHHSVTPLRTCGTTVGVALSQAVRTMSAPGQHQAAAAMLPAASSAQGLKALAGTALRTEAALPSERLAALSPEARIRVHVEETPQGLVVWLGVDAEAAAQGTRAAALAGELRRLLANSGQRLAAVICNGTPAGGAYPLPPTHQEP